MRNTLKNESCYIRKCLDVLLISSQGKTFELIFNSQINLFAPEYLTTEIEKHKQEILEKSSLSYSDFDTILSLISPQISFVSYRDFSSLSQQAKSISPDKNDTEYFALALKLNCPIWSNDKRLKEQSEIRIYSTTELINLLEKN